MAVTKIHSIESTLNLAIDYITQPHKTEEQEFVDGFACSPEFASIEFAKTQSDKNSHSTKLAYHLIQSFEPGETTPEQAHEIGIRLAEKLLKGQYEYVISTHVDKEHIHNHIIINSVNFETGRTFETEKNRKSNPVWRQIRDISDELCKEYGLSVITEPERGKGKSHYEWEQNNSNNSWKSKLKAAIDECIKTADSFDDFLVKMQEKNYEVKQGKYISFRAEGQERFTRSKTLGYYYQEEQLRFRIERRKLYRSSPKMKGYRKQYTEQNPYIHDGKVGRFISIEGKVEQSQGLKNWAIVQNMKNASKLLNQLAEKQVESAEDLKNRIIDLYDYRIDITDEIKQIEADMTSISLNLKHLKNYRDMKPINERYREAKNKDKFFREHESELHLYDLSKKAVAPLVKENGKLPAVTVLEKQYQELQDKKNELMNRYKDIKSEIAELEKIKESIERMEQAQQTRDKSKENNLT